MQPCGGCDYRDERACLRAELPGTARSWCGYSPAKTPVVDQRPRFERPQTGYIQKDHSCGEYDLELLFISCWRTYVPRIQQHKQQHLIVAKDRLAYVCLFPATGEVRFMTLLKSLAHGYPQDLQLYDSSRCNSS